MPCLVFFNLSLYGYFDVYQVPAPLNNELIFVIVVL